MSMVMRPFYTLEMCPKGKILITNCLLLIYEQFLDIKHVQYLQPLETTIAINKFTDLGKTQSEALSMLSNKKNTWANKR